MNPIWIAALLLVFQGNPTTKPAKPKPAPGTVAAERAANLACYKTYYVWQKESLFLDHAGEWVVIAGGKIWPRHPKHNSVEPAKTMQLALAAVDPKLANAKHRYVFRVGEDGDLAYSLGGAQPRHVIGNGFMRYLDDIQWSASAGLLIWNYKGKRKVFKQKGPHKVPFASLDLRAPGAGQGVKPISRRFVFSTGFSGITVMPPDTAKKLDLARFEIPGTIQITGLMQSGPCYRARVQVAVPDLGLAKSLTVAVWKR